MMAEEKLVSEQMSFPELSVWRIGDDGLLISVSEHFASLSAEHSPHIIFFFAEFDTRAIAHDENTIIKVYQAMRSAGISEEQAKNAMFNMQRDGLYFREASQEE